MNPLKIPQFFLARFFSKRSSARLFDIEKKPTKFHYYWGLAIGISYRFMQGKQESLRVWRRNNAKKRQEYSAVLAILRYSAEILFLLLASLFLSVFFDWVIVKTLSHFQLEWFWFYEKRVNLFTSPDEGFLITVLEVCIGALSAILGLIFALYAVGFQLSTEKYSSSISSYINNETFSGFLFKFLVFTDLFALLVLLRVKVINLPVSFSFIAVLFLMFVSLLAIIIFKNDYVVKLKPKALFQRIIGDIDEAVSVASSRHLYTFRSWSVIQGLRSKTSELLPLLRTLFEDLWQAKNWNDVVYAPAALSFILISYAKNKKFIDYETGWWFPQILKEVPAKDMTALPIKLNFEIQGKGPLHVGASDFLWFENNVFETLKSIEAHIGVEQDAKHLLGHVTQCYETILVGNSSKDEYGRYQKDQPGLFDSQEIETFTNFLDGFLKLYEKVSTAEDLNIYLNSFFAIGTTLIGGYNYLEYEKIVCSLVQRDGRLAYSRQEVMRFDVPAIFYAQLVDYWDRLKLEVECEGKVVTPQNLLEKELTERIKVKEKEHFNKFFKKISEHQDQILLGLYQKKKYKQLALLLKVRFEWFSRMLYLKKSEVADEHSMLITKCAGYLLYIPKEILFELELWESVEKLIFPSIIENRKRLFQSLARVLTLLLSVVSTGEKEIENIIYRNRLAIIVGGFVYLVSEYRNEAGLLKSYAQIIEGAFKPGYLVQMLEILAEPKKVGGLDLTLKLIGWETTRYHHWFAQVCWEIDRLPKKYDHVEFYAGMQEVADHPSEFIRNISYQCFNPEEESMEAFVEYIKRRELVRTLVGLLDQRRSKKI